MGRGRCVPAARCRRVVRGLGRGTALWAATDRRPCATRDRWAVAASVLAPRAPRMPDPSQRRRGAEARGARRRGARHPVHGYRHAAATTRSRGRKSSVAPRRRAPLRCDKLSPPPCLPSAGSPAPRTLETPPARPAGGPTPGAPARRFTPHSDICRPRWGQERRDMRCCANRPNLRCAGVLIADILIATAAGQLHRRRNTRESISYPRLLRRVYL